MNHQIDIGVESDRVSLTGVQGTQRSVGIAKPVQIGTKKCVEISPKVKQTYYYKQRL